MQVATLDRVCKHCGSNFVMTKADRPRAGCCSRECHQAWKLANGLRKPAPPKKNDPAEAGVIYGLCDPVTHQVRYIGKTVNLKSRMRRYRSGCHHSPHLKNWIALLGRKGQWPEVKVLETCLFGLGDAEKHWIKHGRERGWDLINATDGGDGWPCTPQSVEKIRQANLRRYQNPLERYKHKRGSQKAAAARLGMTMEAYRLSRAEELRQKRYRSRNAESIRESARLQRIAQKDQREAAERDARQKAFGVLVPLTCKGAAFVPLTRGAWAVVDAEDWDRASRHFWQLQTKQNRVDGPIELRAIRNLPKVNGIKHKELLTRFIAGPSERVEVIDRNALNCRKSSLRIVL